MESNKHIAVASNKNQEVVLSSTSSSSAVVEDKVYVHRIRQKAKQLRDLAAPARSCYTGSDNVSLETEGTGISTLTSSSGGGDRAVEPRRYNPLIHHPRSRNMAPAQYTIFEDELHSRATQSSYISRPIDVDSMQEYEEEDDDQLKPCRLELDDSRSRTTASTYSSRPIDVDSLIEYDPEEYPETRRPDDHSEKVTNNGYYEGESLLEYSSDDDSIDFDTGLSVDSHKGHDKPQLKVSSLKQSPPKPSVQQPVSVNLVGPIHLDTSYLLTVGEDESLDEVSFHEWEFPILDEREFERELVGYMEGFEPVIEDLPPRAPLGRKQSDATSTRSSYTRVTFEI